MRGLAVLFVCACNQTYGIRETRLWDAPPPDGPFTCPPPGADLMFSTTLHQSVLQSCDHYVTTAGGLAMAMCGLSPTGRQIAQGSVDQDLVATPGFFVINGSDDNDDPRPTPDGDRLIVRHRMTRGPLPTTLTFDIYRSSGSGWSFESQAPFGADGDSLSTIARDPVGLRVIVGNTSGLTERVFDGASWPQVATYTPAELGVTSVDELTLSSDGLRAVFHGYDSKQIDHMYYIDRADLSAKLGTPRVLDVPVVQSGAYLADDCARLYFSGLDSVFYAQPL